MNMSHKPITLDKLSFELPHKTCFADFSTIIHPGDRIAIVGANGTGKTTLLKILAGALSPTSGFLSGIDHARIGYLPQNQNFDTNKTIWQIATENLNIDQTQKRDNDLDNTSTQSIHNVESLISRAGFAERKNESVSKLSGGELIRLGLICVLAKDPSILLLDEPTNHLDQNNRFKLMQLINEWPGTALIISHDVELLQTWPTLFWHLHDGGITPFQGSYNDFLNQQEHERKTLLQKIEKLKQEKKLLQKAQDDERTQAAKGKRNSKKALAKGSISRLEYSGLKEQGEKSSGNARKKMNDKRESLTSELQSLFVEEVVKPTFDLPALTHKNAAVYVRDGTIGYQNKIVLKDLSLVIQPGDRVAIVGDNGSGKSTLLKAIMGDQTVTRTGEWHCPPRRLIGYIDQQYSLLIPELTVLEMIQQVRPEYASNQARKLLNDFLFRTPEEVSTLVNYLSGGERARLSLALLVAQAPSILLLDEITNNLDLIARQQVIEAISAFPGTVIVISHDKDFLNLIGVTTVIKIDISR